MLLLFNQDVSVYTAKLFQPERQYKSVAVMSSGKAQ